MVATKSGSGNSDLIKVSASCLADVVTAGPRASLASILRPYKHNKRGQGFIRSVYYRPTFIAIRHYHEANNDQASSGSPSSSCRRSMTLVISNGKEQNVTGTSKRLRLTKGVTGIASLLFKRITAFLSSWVQSSLRLSQTFGSRNWASRFS